MGVSDGSDLFQSFWKSGVHGLTWPSKVVAVVSYSTTRGKTTIFRAECLYGKHAEEQVIDHLKCELEKGMLAPGQDLLLFLNHSPCFYCCKKLRSLAECLWNATYEHAQDTSAPEITCMSSTKENNVSDILEDEFFCRNTISADLDFQPFKDQLPNVHSLIPLLDQEVRITHSLIPAADNRVSDTNLQIPLELNLAGRKISLTIAFASLYLVKRDSCRIRGCRHFIEDDNHIRHVRGLQYLHRKRTSHDQNPPLGRSDVYKTEDRTYKHSCNESVDEMSRSTQDGGHHETASRFVQGRHCRLSEDNNDVKRRPRILTDVETHAGGDTEWKESRASKAVFGVKDFGGSTQNVSDLVAKDRTAHKGGVQNGGSGMREGLEEVTREGLEKVTKERPELVRGGLGEVTRGGLREMTRGGLEEVTKERPEGVVRGGLGEVTRGGLGEVTGKVLVRLETFRVEYWERLAVLLGVRSRSYKGTIRESEDLRMARDLDHVLRLTL